MNAVTAPPTEHETFILPPRPRRRIGGWPVLALCAVILVAVGFLAGVKVEKSQTGASGTTGAAGAFRALAAGGTRTGAGAGTGSATGGTRSSDRTSGAAAGGAPGGAGGFAGGGGSFGTIASISGKAIYLTNAAGNTVRVKLSSATTITKSQSVSSRSLHPGDTIVVRGVSAASGDIAAATISDTGASASSTTGSSSSSGSSTGSAGAAVSSLFGSGGGG